MKAYLKLIRNGLGSLIMGAIGLVIRSIGAVFTFVTLSMFMAAFGIGAIFFVYGRDLPSTAELASYTPKTISRIYSTEGQIIDEFAEERRLFAPASDIPPMVKAAFISAEDKSFYTHSGYDPRGMVAALRDAVVSRGQNLRGASTITQQVMKNFLLDGSRTGERKIKELILATRIEKTLDKEGILELYLNEIFLGQNSYGVAAAAQTYFNKALRDLTPEEAAYLAVLPKAPSNYHPVRQMERAVARRNFVLKEMLENGYLTEEAYQTAVAQPLRTVQSGDYPSFRASLPPRDYPTDEIRRQLSDSYGEAQFFTGGYSVRSTIEPDLQLVAAQALRAGLEEYDRNLGIWRGTGKTIAADGLDAWAENLKRTEVPRDIVTDSPWLPAVVLGFEGGDARIGIEGADDTGMIRADALDWTRKSLGDDETGPKANTADDLVAVGDVVLVQNVAEADAAPDWRLRQVPQIQGGFMAMDVDTGRVLAMQGGFSYQHSVFNRATQAKRQPGSSFKPFVYAAALDSGYSPATIVIDAPIEVKTAQGVWRPRNASNKFYGPTPVRTGIEQSRNLMTIRLAQEVSMETVATYAEKFGVYDNMNPVLAASLGSEETTLYKMVAAYAMFANGGTRVRPTLVDRVQDRYGKTIFAQDDRVCNDCAVRDLPADQLPSIFTNRERVMDPVTAYQLTSMMEGVVKRGTARRTVNLSVPIAGKTGTTNEAKDVWFVGFSNKIAAGCYMGYDQPTPLGRGAGGGSFCGPVFTQFMEEAIAKYGGSKFTVPEGGVFINIDRFSGARLPDGSSGDHVVAEYFREGEEPIFGVTYDGGYAMGSDIPMFSRDADPNDQGTVVINSEGETVIIAPQASFGSLSSGGLY